MLMKYVLLAFIMLLQACSLIPNIGQNVEDVMTDNAIQVQVQRGAISKDTDVQVDVKVRNKDK